MEVHEAIKIIRLQKSINQQVIADALNLDVAVVSNIENGKRDLRVKELKIISNVLGISPVDLFTYPDKYVKLSQKEEDQTEAILQIKLTKEKKDQIMRMLFGHENIEFARQGAPSELLAGHCA